MPTASAVQALFADGLLVEGQRFDPVRTFTYTTYNRVGLTIADNYGEAVLWSTGDGGLDNFTEAFIYSSQELVVELETDNATPEFILIVVPANTLTPLPVRAGGDETESIDGAVLVDGTDYDDVVGIRVQRDASDGSGDAEVTLHLFA